MDGKPCDQVFDTGNGLLTCDLRLIVHSAHHSPAGVWWVGCSLHASHGEEVKGEVRGHDRCGSPVQDSVKERRHERALPQEHAFK